MSPTVPTEPELLLEETAWMRRLARALVRDAAAADDVVQTAWLRAIERGPRSAASPRAWLARVVRNLASKERRSERRRARREQVAAKPEALPPVDDVAERIEVHQGLLAALRALDEPYRRTVTMRYLDGLPTGAIAEVERVTEGTVRWRLSHALELLRTALDRRHGGDRRAWCLALLPSLRDSNLPLSSGAAAAIQGVLVMNVLVKAALAAGAVVGVSAGVWWLRSDVSPAAPATIASAPVAAAELVSPPPPLDELRVEIAPAARVVQSAPPPSSTSPVATAVQTARIRARIADSDGRPLEGARAEIESLNASAQSDPEGRLDLELTPDASREAILRVGLERYATHWIEVEFAPGGTTSLGDIVLERGASISGRVLAPDGEPQANARVVAGQSNLFGPELRSALRGPSKYPGAPSTTTNALGLFRIDGVAPGSVRAWAGAAETRYTWSAPITLPAGEEVRDVELRLVAQSESDSIDGVVIDPDGNPCPKARLRADVRSSAWSEGHWVPLDGQARFHQLVMLDGPHDFRVTDPENRWTEAIALGVQPGARNVTLQFREPRPIELSVRSIAGGPIAAFSVSAARASDREDIGVLKQTAIEAGRCRVPMPNEPFVIAIDAPGYAAATSDAIDPEHAAARVDFALEPRAGIAGVVRAKGEALGGARVRLFATPAKNRCYQIDGYDLRVQPMQLSEVTTGGDGRFLLTPSAAGEFELIVQADGWATAERGPIALAAGQENVELAIDLDRGGSIEGRVLVPDGQSAEGLIVSINRGDTLARTVRTDAEGRYRFDVLAAGPWQVRQAEEMVDGIVHGTSVAPCERAEFPSDCTVEVGQTTHFDLDLRDTRPCVVDGELVWGGHSTRGWTVSLRPASGVVFAELPPSVAVDELGRFALSVKQPGAYRLAFVVPGSTSELLCPLELARGRASWFASIDTATLVVRNHSGEGLSVRAGTTEHDFYGNVESGAETALELPAGRVELGRYVVNSDPALSGWRASLALDLAHGEKRTVDAP